jgi:hypothetical protein
MKVRVAWKTTARDSRTLQDRTTNQIEFSESSAETFGYRCLGIPTHGVPLQQNLRTWILRSGRQAFKVFSSYPA